MLHYSIGAQIGVPRMWLDQQGTRMAIHATLRKGKLARFLPWLIGLFVVAQIIASAHAAAYGESKHSHDGHPCIISTVCKQASSADLVSPAVSLVAPEWHEHYQAEQGSISALQDVAHAAIRAPPSHH